MFCSLSWIRGNRIRDDSEVWSHCWSLTTVLAPKLIYNHSTWKVKHLKTLWHICFWLLPHKCWLSDGWICPYWFAHKQNDMFTGREHDNISVQLYREINHCELWSRCTEDMIYKRKGHFSHNLEWNTVKLTSA